MEIKNITNLKDLKKGELFKRVSKKGIGTAVYVRGDYDKSSKTYECYKYEDINSFINLKGNSVVCVEFEF